MTAAVATATACRTAHEDFINGYDGEAADHNRFLVERHKVALHVQQPRPVGLRVLEEPDDPGGLSCRQSLQHSRHVRGKRGAARLHERRSVDISMYACVFKANTTAALAPD